MIKVIFYQRADEYIGVKVTGHAGFARKGKDIVCSAVSALTINTVNSIYELTDCAAKYEVSEDGTIRCRVYDITPENQLLLKSLRLGLCDVYKEYGDDYIRVYFKEVKTLCRD